MVTFEAPLAFTAAVLCVALGAIALYQEPRALVPRVFAGGMLAVALREILMGLGSQATLPIEEVSWKLSGWIVTLLLPAIWIPFSLSFARDNAKTILSRWKWLIVVLLALPIVLVILFGHRVLRAPFDVAEASLTALPLGWTGYLLAILGLLTALLVLVNLEATLKAVTGTKRWRVKFMILAVGCIFVVYLFTMSQTLLYSSFDSSTQTLESGTVIVAGFLIILSLRRQQRLGSTTITLSQKSLYQSFTVLFAGIYLLSVGVLAKVIGMIGAGHHFQLVTLFVFASLVFLAVLLLSEQMQQQLKRFISRHIYGVRHDYRQVWMSFTKRTSSLVDVGELCQAAASFVSETFAVPSVTIWLEDQQKCRLGGSTMFSADQQHPLGFTEQAWAGLVGYLGKRRAPVDFSSPPDAEGNDLKQLYGPELGQSFIQFAVPLLSGDQLLAVMTLSHRLTGEPLNPEDINLLRVIAADVATSIHNLQLSQRLARAQQMEAFQTLSAFFVHDLKNLASKLALTLQNLPRHYSNPEFREDLVQLISGTEAKIGNLCSRLSLLTQRLDLHCTPTDLNELVNATLADMESAIAVRLLADLHPLPSIPVDREQIQKVLVNLVLNAQEATDENGEIRIATQCRDGWAEVSVQDTGCGIPKEFMERSLFQPFHTTKQRGLGIGLFQSKVIMEAHEGKIEVESEEGNGTVFRLLLKCKP